MRFIAAAVIAATSLGCVSHDGVYSPACDAYAGNTITLSAGNFTWEKFTDEMIIGKDGEAVDQFPGYPLNGSYRVDDNTVYMEADSGGAIDTLYLRQQNNRYYLLSEAQRDAVEKTGTIDACALTLGDTSDN